MEEKEKIFNLIRHKVFQLVDLRLHLERIENMNNKEDERKIKNKHNWTFLLIQKVYHEQLILGISTLLDSAKTCKNKNLSLKALEKIYENDSHISKIFKTFFDDVKNKELIEITTRYRSKMLAHNDLNTILDPERVTFPEFQHLENLLDPIYTLLNEISIRENDSETLYNEMDDDPIEDLINDLKIAQNFETLCQENAEFREYINKWGRDSYYKNGKIKEKGEI